MRKLFFTVAIALVSLASTAQTSMRANTDPSVKPGDDFWQYAVGGWLKANPLDAQHPENGAFTDLYELNNERINKLILAYAEKKDLPQGSDGQKIGALYRLYMDSVSRNRMGYEPIMPYLRQVREVQTRDEALRLMYELDAKGFNAAPFGLSLGETIGKLYVKEFFPESSKQRVYRMVKDLQQAFEDRLKENTWMSDSTKAKALEKLHAMHINVGYPDKWQDMEKFIDIRETENLVENFIRIKQESRQAGLRKYWHQPVDKTMMPCSPQTVNAFYHPLFNSINFPAAILQPPFFDPEADYVCNYGAIGAVIGHEMTHGFDDQGCQFDKDGNLKNWWTAEDKARYDERTKVIADWFSEQEAVPGLKVNGQKTLGENVSDNGGLKIAYRAYKNRMASEPLSDVEGFTPDQRFYLAYARVWACNSTPEYIAMLVNSDVHSPARLRVMAALPMIDTWYEAFGIQPTDKMFIPKEKRALVW